MPADHTDPKKIQSAVCVNDDCDVSGVKIIVDKGPLGNCPTCGSQLQPTSTEVGHGSVRRRSRAIF